MGWKDADWPKPPYTERGAHSSSVRRKLDRIQDTLVAIERGGRLFLADPLPGESKRG